MPRFLPLLLLALAAVAARPAGAAPITVSTLADEQNADGDCSLREALAAAETDAPVDACPAGSGADEITFSVFGEVPFASVRTLTTTVSILGPGADLLTFRETGNGGLFFLNGGRLTINGVTLAGAAGGSEPLINLTNQGALVATDCVFSGNEALNSGGALSIYNTSGADTGSTATLTRCRFADNRTDGDGGAVSVNGPGHVVTLDRCTFARNHAALGGGAIILNGASTVVVESSTLSGNTADGHGGGILAPSGSVFLRNSTLTVNVADAEHDGTGEGGGVWSVADLRLRNTIVAGNDDASPGGLAADDLYLDGPTVSDGHNLIGNNGGYTALFPAGQPNAGTDWVGTIGSPLAAQLGPLADNGGPTPTHRPAGTSPAVDHGQCVGAGTDQRGQPRPFDAAGVPNTGDGCDIGAVELQLVETAAGEAPGATAAYALGPVRPTPTTGRAAATLTVDRAQTVEAVLFDLTGRRVAVVFRGAVAAGVPETLALDGAALAPGAYVLRVTGEDFAEARRVVVVR